MNKFIISALTALTIAAGATAAEPNRVIIRPAAGPTLSYRTDRIQDISFAAVEGEVIAEAKIIKIGEIGAEEAVTVSVTMSEACKGYKYMLVPQAMIGMYDDATLASYIDANATDIKYESFEAAALSGIKLDAVTNYVFATVAYDEYGTLCDVSRAPFTTPAVDLVGDPTCTWKLEKAGLYSLELTITPNKDVAGWACCLYEKGQLEEQFNSFAPMFGFANYGQMVKSWGIVKTAQETVTWNQLAPNTTYEIAIQAWDVNENFAPLVIAEVSTNNQGGTGEAITIAEIGEYMLNDWGGELKPSQFISYTPNKETMRYRFGVYTKAQYEEDPEGYKSDIQSEPPMPNMSGWWFYDEFTTDYQIDPGIECVVITASQNANYEWGEPQVTYFTTPAEMPKGLNGAKAPAVRDADEAAAIMTRVQPKAAVKGATVPVISLTGK